MPVTVYIPCHNAERFISGCLEALMTQSLKPAEVLVVNDGSTDRTIEIAQGFPIKIIDLPSHPGLAAARNAAITAASHDYIASVDVDCIPEPSWLEQLTHAIDESGATGAGGMLLEKYQDKIADRWRAVHMRQNWGNEKVENPPFLFGCNTLFRKSALEDVGLYNVKFTTNGEDVDISHRLKRKGYTLLYEPSAVIRHLKRDTILSVLKADWKWGHIASGDTVKYESNSNIIYHNFTNAKYRFLQDLSSESYTLLPLDIMLFFFHSYLDICHGKRLKLDRTSRKGLGSRIDTLTKFHDHLARLSRSHFLQNPDSYTMQQHGNDTP